jgi:hypothetical protein
VARKIVVKKVPQLQELGQHLFRYPYTHLIEGEVKVRNEGCKIMILSYEQDGAVRCARFKSMTADTSFNQQPPFAFGLVRMAGIVL